MNRFSIRLKVLVEFKHGIQLDSKADDIFQDCWSTTRVMRIGRGHKEVEGDCRRTLY